MTTAAARIKGQGVDPEHYREVMGHYPTGVAVVTGTSPEGDPIGMVVGTFTAVSLDPPLVAFMPTTTSGTYALMKDSPSFCVNVLAHDQLELCRLMAVPRPGKFDEVGLAALATGRPCPRRRGGSHPLSTAGRGGGGRPPHRAVRGRADGHHPASHSTAVLPGRLRRVQPQGHDRPRRRRPHRRGQGGGGGATAHRAPRTHHPLRDRRVGRRRRPRGDHGAQRVRWWCGDAGTAGRTHPADASAR